MNFIYTTDVHTKEILEKKFPLIQTNESTKQTFWCFLNISQSCFDKEEDKDLKIALSDTLLF